MCADRCVCLKLYSHPSINKVNSVKRNRNHVKYVELTKYILLGKIYLKIHSANCIKKQKLAQEHKSYTAEMLAKTTKIAYSK